jgi:7-keto-8-aminopelargonate synthetase-like enzyme
VLVGSGAAVIVDAQTHASVQLACQVLRAEGVPTYTAPHNDLAALDELLDTLTADYSAIWYLADGVYSMFGDVAPIEELSTRLERHPTFHIYYDDAHGFGWAGLHGRGVVLGEAPPHPRMVVAVSLSKSFGSGGAALIFADAKMAERVRLTGGTLTFSGPLHPAELGAAVASADIHLSLEHLGLQRRLQTQIEFVTQTSRDLELPIRVRAQTPIWFVHIGSHDQAVEVGRRMVADGYFLNLASFPVVPLGASGLRFTHTLYHDEDQIGSMLEQLAKHVSIVTSG